MKQVIPLIRWAVILLFSTTFLFACAQVHVKHVDFKDTSDGVHFCQPRPYLLIGMQLKSSGDAPPKNEYSNQIIYLPDYSQCYTVNVTPGWGTVNGSVKLQNGWMLDTFGANMDSKGPETINAITGLVTAVASAAKSAGEPIEGLYLIDIKPDGNVKLIRQNGWVIEKK